MNNDKDKRPNERVRAIVRRIPALLLALGVAVLVSRSDIDTILNPAQAKPVSQRQIMPGFTFPTLDGKPWSLSSHRGHVVLVNFWATWCPPCRAETPDLVKLAREYKSKGVDVVGISMDDGNVPGVRSFAASYSIPYPILIPTQGSPVTAPIQALPTTVIVDRQGQIAAGFEGELDMNSAKSIVRRLLAEPASTSRHRPATR